MADSAPRVAIVAGARTPFAKAGTKLKEHSALDLARHAVDGLLDRHGLAPSTIDEMVYGIVVLGSIRRSPSRNGISLASPKTSLPLQATKTQRPRPTTADSKRKSSHSTGSTRTRSFAQIRRSRSWRR